MKFVHAMFAAVAVSAIQVSASNPKPFTVPEIASWRGADGCFQLPDTIVVWSEGSTAVDMVARQVSADMHSLTSRPVKVVIGKRGKHDIGLKLVRGKGKSDEWYRIKANADNVTVEATDIKGLRHGAASVMQIIEQQGCIPAGVAEDAPQYALRGLMVDAGRKYIPMDYLYKLVDAMAYYKMNTLQVHLNDNGFKYFYDDDWDKTQAAFRLECDSYPGLTARDGSYGKDEFRTFVEYAVNRGVNIIPEIDFPAHALAFTRYMPEIGSTDDQYGRDHLDLTSERTYEFLDTLLAEYMQGPDPVFAGPVVHIGTDEYSNRDSTIVERFRALTDRYIHYVKSFGKQPAIWGSLTHAKGKTPVESDDVIMYSWSTGYANPEEMLAQGFKMVSIPDGYVYIVPEAGYYYDYLNTEMLYDKWTPAVLGPGFEMREGHPQIEGGMFAVWNDHPNNGVTVKDIHHRIMHALPTMSAKTWSGNKVTVPFEEFESASEHLSEAPGLNYLARYETGGKPLLSLTELLPDTTLPVPEIGYDYTVEFDLTGADEQLGTKLLENDGTVFWLSDPISGLMGFSREGHLATFRHDVRPGEKVHVKIAGDNKGTRLWIDGRLIDDLNVRRVSYNGSKRQMAQSRTLVFPLNHSGRFASRITNFVVRPGVD